MMGQIGDMALSTTVMLEPMREALTSAGAPFVCDQVLWEVSRPRSLEDFPMVEGEQRPDLRISAILWGADGRSVHAERFVLDADGYLRPCDPECLGWVAHVVPWGWLAGAIRLLDEWAPSTDTTHEEHK